MALTFTLKERGNDVTVIDLVYDEDLNAAYQMHISSHDLSGNTNPLFHVPDNAPQELLDLVPENSTLFFRANLIGSSMDDTLNKIATLARWIDGEDQQAARHHTRKDVERIEVEVQLEGATNSTVIPVIYGGFQTFSALLNEFGLASSGAYSFGVTLIVAPYGEGPVIDISISNLMGNDLTAATANYISPAFLHDSDGDGLADGWNISGSPPFMPKQLVSSPALIGGQSQEVTFEDTSDRLHTDDIATSGSLVYYGYYVWCCVGTFEGTFGVGLYGASLYGAIEFDTSDPLATALDTAVDPYGNMWYKVGSNEWGINYTPMALTIKCTAVTTSGTMYFDGAYLHIGNNASLSPIPRTWVSQGSLSNRGDYMVAGANYCNWFDVWGVPGDAPAIARWKITADTVTLKRHIIAARWRDTQHKVADYIYEIESNDSGWTYPAGWSNQSSSAYTNGHSKRFTSSGSSTTAYIQLTGTNARAVLAGTRRVFARAYTNDLTSTITMSVYIGTDNSGIKVSDSTAAVLQASATWELIDLGTLHGTGMVPISDFWGSSSPSLYIELVLDVPNAKVFDIDFVRILPTEEFLDHTTIDAWLDYLTTDTLWIDGHETAVFLANESPKPAGSMFYLDPGTLNRIYFNFLYLSGTGLPDMSYSQTALSETFTVELEITPRTRHLLGTV